jgi:hypothetical protein
MEYSLMLKKFLALVFFTISPSINAAALYSTALQGHINAYDAATGSVINNFGQVNYDGGLAYGDGVLYSTALQGHINAYDVATGAVINSFGQVNYDGGLAYGVSAVPVPAAAWLFGSALIGLVGINRRK